MACAAREVTREFVGRTWNRTVSDTVTIDVFVASPVKLPLVELFDGDDFTTVNGSFWVFIWIGDPEVHPEVEVAEDEDGSLETLCEVEGDVSKLKALFGAGGEQDDVTTVPMREEVRRDDITL